MKYVCHSSTVLKEPPEMPQEFWALRLRINLEGDTNVALALYPGQRWKWSEEKLS